MSERNPAELRNSMKALIISNQERGFSAGHLSMIRPLQEFGYEVTWASDFREYRDDLASAPCRTVQIDFIRHPLHPGNLRAYAQLTRLLREQPFRLIHCNSPIGGVLGRMCGSRVGVPVIIYTAHGFHFFNGAPIVNRVLYRWVEMVLAHRTDVLITINQEDYMAAKRFRLRSGGMVYRISGIGVDTRTIWEVPSKRTELLAHVGGNESSVILISVGELNRNKNSHVIIRALGVLQNPDLHLVLCGTGDCEAELMSLVRRFGLDRSVHFMGYRDDVYWLLKSSDVFVLASHREGLPRSVMEAMSAGLPCIVSRVRGNVDLIENGVGGYLCTPDDVEGFARAISALTADPVLRQTMGFANLQAIREFDVGVVRSAMKTIYASALRHASTDVSVS